jgi:hypothetical protein
VHAPAVALLGLVCSLDLKILPTCKSYAVRTLSHPANMAEAGTANGAEFESIAAGAPAPLPLSANDPEAVDCDPPNPLLSLPVEAEPGLPTAFVASPTYTLSRYIPVAEADRSAWVIREHVSVRFSISLLIGSPVSGFFPQRLNRESQRLAVRVGYLRRSFWGRPSRPSGVAGRKEAGNRPSNSYPQPYPASAHGVDRQAGYLRPGSPQSAR